MAHWSQSQDVNFRLCDLMPTHCERQDQQLQLVPFQIFNSFPNTCKLFQLFRAGGFNCPYNIVNIGVFLSMILSPTVSV